jgi:hypothetical protein
VEGTWQLSYFYLLLHCKAVHTPSYSKALKPVPLTLQSSKHRACYARSLPTPQSSKPRASHARSLPMTYYAATRAFPTALDLPYAAGSTLRRWIYLTPQSSKTRASYTAELQSPCPFTPAAVATTAQCKAGSLNNDGGILYKGSLLSCMGRTQTTTLIFNH